MRIQFVILVLVIFQVTQGYKSVNYVCPSKSVNITEHFENFIKNIALNFTELNVKCNDKQFITIQSNLIPRNDVIQRIKISGFGLKLLPNAFKNCNSLTDISIQDCDIMIMSKDVFSGAKNLANIDISRNNLKIINPDLFGKIKYLNYSDNNIKYFSIKIYNKLIRKVDKIILLNNPLQCHCINKWLIFNKYDQNKLKFFSNVFSKCDKTKLEECNYYFSVNTQNFSKNVLSFSDVVVKCPLIVNSTHPHHIIWISPTNDAFGNTDYHKGTINNVAFTIQPLFFETVVAVNESNNVLSIHNFRGFFGGNWTCRAVSISGEYMEAFVTLTAYVELYNIFIQLVIIGFSVSGVFFFIAAVIGFSQYMKETSCFKHKIDYDNSELFEKRYVHTVIPVPYEENMSSSSGDSQDSNDSESSMPLNSNSRSRHESYSNNDVQLIFTDEKLAQEYVKILEELKHASETGDEHFKDRLNVLRNRFSIDFQKMRFELKRGMESLRSNSTAAAQKIRKSVRRHVYDHVRSFTEFCGTSNMAQSISIVVIPENQSNHPTSSGNHHSGVSNANAVNHLYSTSQPFNLSTDENTSGTQSEHQNIRSKKVFRFFERPECNNIEEKE